MTAYMICSTVNLTIDDENKGLYNDFYLTSPKDITEIVNYFPNKELWRKPGFNFVNHVSQTPHFVTQKEFNSKEECYSYAGHELVSLENIIFYLWFVKDNSVSLSRMEVLGDEIGASMHPPYTNSNAEGKFTTTHFSKSEFDKAFDYMLLAASIKSKDKTSDIDSTTYVEEHVTASSLTSMPYNSNSRIIRAFLFLQNARSSSLLPAKISFYVLILECLFSANDTGEIKHKISERVALYLGENTDHCQQIFYDVKQAYNVRSSYFHGQQLSSNMDKLNKLGQMSLLLDNLVRSVFIKILQNNIENFSSKNDNLSDFLNSMLFR